MREYLLQGYGSGDGTEYDLTGLCLRAIALYRWVCGEVRGSVKEVWR